MAKVNVEEQTKRLIQDIEGIVNDFESYVTEKDETIMLLVNYVVDRADAAVKNDRVKHYDVAVKYLENVVSWITDSGMDIPDCLAGVGSFIEGEPGENKEVDKL